MKKISENFIDKVVNQVINEAINSDGISTDYMDDMKHTAEVTGESPDDNEFLDSISAYDVRNGVDDAPLYPDRKKEQMDSDWAEIDDAAKDSQARYGKNFQELDRLNAFTDTVDQYINDTSNYGATDLNGAAGLIDYDWADSERNLNSESVRRKISRIVREAQYRAVANEREKFKKILRESTARASRMMVEGMDDFKYIFEFQSDTGQHQVGINDLNDIKKCNASGITYWAVYDNSKWNFSEPDSLIAWGGEGGYWHNKVNKPAWVTDDNWNKPDEKTMKMIMSKKKDIMPGETNEYVKCNKSEKVNEGIGDVLYKGSMGILGALFVALLGCAAKKGYDIVNRDAILNKVHKDFVEEYKVDPDTLQKSDPRFKTFAKKEMDELISKGFINREDSFAYRNGRDIKANTDDYNTTNDGTSVVPIIMRQMVR